MWGPRSNRSESWGSGKVAPLGTRSGASLPSSWAQGPRKEHAEETALARVERTEPVW